MFSPMFVAVRLRINWDLWTVTWKGACHVPQGVAPVYPPIGQHSSCFRVLLSTGPKEALHPTPPHVSHGFAITKPWVATFLSFGLCVHICIGACTCGGQWWFPYRSSLHILRQGLQEPGAHWSSQATCLWVWRICCLCLPSAGIPDIPGFLCGCWGVWTQVFMNMWPALCPATLFYLFWWSHKLPWQSGSFH